MASTTKANFFQGSGTSRAIFSNDDAPTSFIIILKCLFSETIYFLLGKDILDALQVTTFNGWTIIKTMITHVPERLPFPRPHPAQNSYKFIYSQPRWLYFKMMNENLIY